MKSPSPISKATVVAAINRNSYEDMVNIYRKYGLGEPSAQTLRFYQRIVRENDKGLPKTSIRKRYNESLALSMLLEAILIHELHNASENTLAGTISRVEGLELPYSLMERQVAIHKDESN